MDKNEKNKLMLSQGLVLSQRRKYLAMTRDLFEDLEFIHRTLGKYIQEHKHLIDEMNLSKDLSDETNTERPKGKKPDKMTIGGECLDVSGENYITTRELADFCRVRSQTILSSLCLKGNYLGQKPIKMPNGRLLWVKSDFSCDKYKSARKYVDEVLSVIASPIKN